MILPFLVVILCFLILFDEVIWNRICTIIKGKCLTQPKYNCFNHHIGLIRRYRRLREELASITRTENSHFNWTCFPSKLSSDVMKSPMAQSGAQFLPGFLLGEPEVSHEVINRSQMSPEHMNISPRQNTSRLSPLQVTTFRPHYNRGAKTVLNGPPIASLFDEELKTRQECEINNSSILGTSHDRMDVVHNESIEIEGHWIVVYGFPPSASAHVLSLFSQLGQVLEHSFPTSGNWMFLKFGNRGDVRKALTYNERIINGNIMIGVSERKNINQMRMSCPTTPNFNVNTSHHLNSSGNMMSPVTSPKIRHLSMPRRETSATPDQPTPQKDTSVVAKAIDFIFGW